MSGNAENKPPPMKFGSVLQADVPKGRDGKHKQIITQLLSDIAQLTAGSALKIPLTELPDTKENVRAALSRAARQQGIDLATSSNEEFLFVWHATAEPGPSKFARQRRARLRPLHPIPQAQILGTQLPLNPSPGLRKRCILSQMRWSAASVRRERDTPGETGPCVKQPTSV